MFSKKKQQQMLEEGLTKVVTQNIQVELAKFMETFEETAREIVRDEFKKLQNRT
jgi:hypothetical protein